MKLFLSSTNISANLMPHFLALVGKNIEDIRFALIENAADPYSDDEKKFMYDTRKVFESSGMKVTLIDLREYKNDPESLYIKLKSFDVVWAGGGNTYYLRWLMNASGFDTIIKKLLDAGIIYGGGSAGSIITCPVLDKFDVVDNVDLSPEVIKEGLGLIDFIIIPHWGTPEFQNGLERIKDYYDHETNYKVTTITDSQAIIVYGNEWEVYPK